MSVVWVMLTHNLLVPLTWVYLLMDLHNCDVLFNSAMHLQNWQSCFPYSTLHRWTDGLMILLRQFCASKCLIEIKPTQQWSKDDWKYPQTQTQMLGFFLECMPAVFTSPKSAKIERLQSRQEKPNNCKKHNKISFCLIWEEPHIYPLLFKNTSSWQVPFLIPWVCTVQPHIA